MTNSSAAVPATAPPNQVVTPAPLNAEQKPVANTVNIGVPTATTEKSPDIWPTVITATASVMSAAAWPLGIVIVVLTFKKQLGGLIDRMKTLKGPGGLEATFEDLVAELPPPTAPPADQPPQVPASVQLAPIDAIVTAWVSVERAISDLYDRRQLIATSTISSNLQNTARARLGLLRQTGVISPSLGHEILILNRARNRAVHEPDEPIDQEAVQQYITAAASVKAMLDEIPGDPDAIY